MRNSTWALSNLCRNKPSPELAYVKPILLLLYRLLNSPIVDEEILTDACWACSYFTDGTNERIDAFLATNLAPKIVAAMIHQNPAIATPSLRTIGNIVSGNDDQTQYILNLNVLNNLKCLLSHSKKSLRKEACWTLSNITAGTFFHFSFLMI